MAGILALAVNKNFLVLLNSGMVLFLLLVVFKSRHIHLLGLFFVVNLCIFQMEFYLDVIIYISVYLILGKNLKFWVIDIIVSALLLLCVFIISVKMWNTITSLQKIRIDRRKWFIIIETIVFIINMVIVTIENKFISKNNNLNENIFTIIVFSGILCSFIFLGFVGYYLLVTYEKHTEMLSLNKRYLQQQKTYCDSLKFNNDELRKIRHDIRQHLYSINILLTNNKIEEAKDYTDKLLATMGKVIKLSLSNNIIIDSIIEQYTPVAMENDITINFAGKMPLDVTINDYDICTIFYNLLLNAIEECSKIDGRKEIFIQIGYYNKYININMNNPLYRIPPQKGKTLKADKINHGYGLKNVEHCVNANNGSMKIECSNNEFKVSIILEGNANDI